MSILLLFVFITASLLFAGMCKHVHLVLLIYSRCPGSEERRKEIAKDANNYIYDENEGLFSIFSEYYNLESIVYVENKQCNCVASSFGVECVCLYAFRQSDIDVYDSTSTADNSLGEVIINNAIVK